MNTNNFASQSTEARNSANITLNAWSMSETSWKSMEINGETFNEFKLSVNSLYMFLVRAISDSKIKSCIWFTACGREYCFLFAKNEDGYIVAKETMSGNDQEFYMGERKRFTFGNISDFADRLCDIIADYYYGIYAAEENISETEISEAPSLNDTHSLDEAPMLVDVDNTINGAVLYDAAIELAEECVAWSAYVEWFDEDGKLSDSALTDYVEEYFVAINDYEELDEKELKYFTDIFQKTLYEKLVEAKNSTPNLDGDYMDITEYPASAMTLCEYVMLNGKNTEWKTVFDTLRKYSFEGVPVDGLPKTKEDRFCYVSMRETLINIVNMFRLGGGYNYTDSGVLTLVRLFTKLYEQLMDIVDPDDIEEEDDDMML